MKKSYAILGGGGSFGIHTAFYLLDHANPKKVLGIGRNPLRSSPFSLDIQNRDRFTYYTRHITYEFDLLIELLDQEKPEIIINFAAQGEGAVSWKNSWRFFETNTVALSKLCETLMSRSWVERFIHIGTSEMYGSVTKPADELSEIKPSSPYAASKVAFDLYLLSVFKNLSFPMNIIRPSNSYCPGQLLHRVIPKTVMFGLTGKKIPLHGGGKAEKSYIHARDLAKAIYLVSVNAPLGEIYNAGPNNPISILEIVKKIANVLQKDFNDLCVVTEDRLGQDSKYWLDSKKIFEHVGWYPEIDLDTGLNEMVQWGTKYLNELRNYSTDYVMRG